jgi:hypothetical protein
MSLENVQTIIGRAVTEPEYRALLFSDPDKALEGYELNEKEAAALKGLEREKFDAVASDLEERISRAGPGLAAFDPGRMLIPKKEIRDFTELFIQA